MKDETVITAVGMICVTVFGSIAVASGYDDYLIGAIIFVIATAMGIMLPQPKFLRK